MRDLEGFKRWLVDRGAEILEPTNPYEVLRFRANSEVKIVYRRECGSLTFTRDSDRIYQLFRRGDTSWRATNPTRRKRLTPLVKTLRKRDGDGCFYCGRDLFGALRDDAQRTVEHLVPAAHGGPNHLSNLVLACESCNQEAGHLSVAEKVALREKKRRLAYA